MELLELTTFSTAVLVSKKSHMLPMSFLATRLRNRFRAFESSGGVKVNTVLAAMEVCLTLEALARIGNVGEGGKEGSATHGAPNDLMKSGHSGKSVDPLGRMGIVAADPSGVAQIVRIRRHSLAADISSWVNTSIESPKSF